MGTVIRISPDIHYRGSEKIAAALHSYGVDTTEYGFQVYRSGPGLYDIHFPGDVPKEKILKRIGQIKE